MALTSKQERFCQCIASGMDYMNSYMEAYNCQSKNAANVESTKLLKRDDITERITQLRKPIVNLMQNKAISERQQQINNILERIEICKQKEDEQSLIRYYDMLNKIYALYKDTDQEQKQENKLASIDVLTLKKLSNAQ